MFEFVFTLISGILLISPVSQISLFLVGCFAIKRVYSMLINFNF